MSGNARGAWVVVATLAILVGSFFLDIAALRLAAGEWEVPLAACMLERAEDGEVDEVGHELGPSTSPVWVWVEVWERHGADQDDRIDSVLAARTPHPRGPPCC